MERAAIELSLNIRRTLDFIGAETLNKTGICKLVVERFIDPPLGITHFREQIKRGSLCLQSSDRVCVGSVSSSDIISYVKINI
jgi:hypothetical protein